MLITSTKDILFFILAVCVLLITVFIIWLLFYLIAILRDIHRISRNVEDKIEKAGVIIDFIKKKVDYSTGHFILLVEAVKEILKFVMEKRCKKVETKGKKK